MTKRSLGLALLGLLFSCSSEDLTQLMVVVDTDFDIPAELDEVSIEVIAPDGLTTNSEAAIDESNLPLRLAMVHRSGPLGPVRVKVEGFLRGAVKIQRRAEVFFVEGEVRELRLDLLRSCEGVACAVDETCGADGCRRRLVTEDELPPWDGPMRLDFGVPDMGPADMRVDGCVAVEELCNGADDDCDGDVDEAFDLQTDMRHCGRCDNACAADPARGSETCEAGACVLVCDPGFGDCDGDDEEISTGCEAALSGASTCGSCDQSCTGGTPFCDLGTCVAACPTGTEVCPGGDGACVDVQSSVTNCGACGMECSDAANASPFCSEGECALRCDMGFFNCDAAIANGCESRQRDLANCGACGAVCTAADGDTSCETGTCELVSCDFGFEDCDGDLMNGCEANVEADPTTCGGCGLTCPAEPPNAASICEMGSCGLQCDPGFADCTDEPGCETFLGAPTSCGGCGLLCDGATPNCSGSPSSGFACSGDCADGLTPCGASCVDVTDDVRNCDGCGIVCPDPMRASPTCSDGVCAFTCDAGFEDCDGDPVNGCEADLASTGDCGSCDNTCAPVPNGTITCAMDTCAIATCDGTTRNCDGTYANGCEADISSDTANCGGCSVTCVPGLNVAAVSCTGGRCVIESCETGFDDCDGDFETGCEQPLGTRNHCAACGDRCRGSGGNWCCDGVCGFC